MTCGFTSGARPPGSLRVVFVLLVYPRRYTHRAYLGYALASYRVAKAAEFHDREIYALTAQA